MKQVAKDWCMTIRASQVIPIYPLSEDLQPGDMFLVDSTIHDQKSMYEARGFLPLPMQIGRLSGFTDAYKEFYGASYWTGEYARLAHARTGGAAAGSTGSGASEASSASAGSEEGGDGKKDELSLLAAPRVAFPSYEFAVTQGQGLSLAFPVQGVPVGLGLLNSDQAAGTISLKDAYSYGLGIQDIVQKLDAWSRLPAHRALLMSLGGQKGRSYLRIVSRVFIARSISVSLSTSGATSFGLDVGKITPVELMDPSKSLAIKSAGVKKGLTLDESTKLYEEAKKALAKDLTSDRFGGSLRLASAFGRSVELIETFKRPLVLGYLGFDVFIKSDGSLSAPVATLNLLEGNGKVDEQSYLQAAVTLDSIRGALDRMIDHGDSRAVLEFAKKASEVGWLASSPEIVAVRQEVEALLAQTHPQGQAVRSALNPLFVEMTFKLLEDRDARMAVIMELFEAAQDVR